MESDAWIIQMRIRLLKINKRCASIHFNMLVLLREPSILFLLPFLWTLLLSCKLILHRAWTFWLKFVVSNCGGGGGLQWLYNLSSLGKLRVCDMFVLYLSRCKYFIHKWWWISFLTFVLLWFDETGQLSSYCQWLLNQNRLTLGHSC